MEKNLLTIFVTTIGLSTVSCLSYYYYKAQNLKKKPKLKLYYFNTPGKGECVRLLCTYSNLDFEDVRISSDDLGNLKKEGKLVFGQVPALEVDGKNVLVQSAAIMRYLGKLTGLYPSCPLQAAKVDAIIDQENDLFSGLSVSRYSERFGFGVLNDHKDMVTVIRKELNDNVIPRHLQALENIAEKSLTGWITGTNEPSIADFILVPRLEWLTSGANTGISTEILNAFPHLLSLIQKLKNLPAIKSYSLNKQTIF